MPSAKVMVGLFAVASLAVAGTLAVLDGNDGPEAVPAASPIAQPPIPDAAPDFTITSVDPAVDSLSVDWTMEGVLGERTQMIFYRQGDAEDSYILEDDARTAIIAGLVPDTEVRFCLVAADDRANESLPAMPEGDAPGCATDKTLAQVPVEPPATVAPVEPIAPTQEAAAPPPSPVAPPAPPPPPAPASPAPVRAASAPAQGSTGPQRQEDRKSHGKGSDKNKKQDDKGHKGHGKKN